MTTDPYGQPQYDPQYSDPPGGGYHVPSDRGEAASKKLAAGLCGILLGGLGVHKFILGYTNAGVIMLVTTLACATVGACLVFPVLGAMAMSVIGLVEGIIYLTKSDDEFYETYMVRQKEWF